VAEKENESIKVLQQRFECMLERHRKDLEAVCRQFFPADTYHQQEVMQRIASRLWNILAAHADEDAGEWEQWCVNVARQEAIDYLRSRDYKVSQHMRTYSDLSEEPAADEDSSTKMETELDGMDRLLRKLDVKDYRLVELYLGGLSNKEIAQRLGINLRMLHYRMHDIREKLRKMQEEENEI
jgi:RNA polymerase sigma factor (sigma-70 family)